MTLMSKKWKIVATRVFFFMELNEVLTRENLYNGTPTNGTSIMLMEGAITQKVTVQLLKVFNLIS